MTRKSTCIGLCFTIVLSLGGVAQTAGAAQVEPSRIETKASERPAPLDASEMESYSQLEKLAAEDGALDQTGAEASTGTTILAGVGAVVLILAVLAAAAA